MTNREKFKKVFGIDVKWSDALFPQIVALSSIQLQGVACGEEWLNDEYTEQPNADVTPVVHGTWKGTKELCINHRGQIMHEVICSECNGISYFRAMGNKYIGANICPNCGADMRGGEEC